MTEITFKSDMGVELIDSMGSDETVARAARVSTGRDQLEQGKIEGLIGYLMRAGHSSTFEHCSLTVRVHVPISTHRQAMTHRTLSKNSESGRYKELEPTFYLPDGDRPLANAGSGAHPDLVKLEFDFGEFVRRREAHYNACWEQYQWELSQGVATEVARDVLPVATYTSAYMTGNLLAWFNFLRLRAGYTGHPQHEIQEVAKKVEAVIADLFPITYAAWLKTVS